MAFPHNSADCGLSAWEPIRRWLFTRNSADCVILFKPIRRWPFIHNSADCGFPFSVFKPIRWWLRRPNVAVGGLSSCQPIRRWLTPRNSADCVHSFSHSADGNSLTTPLIVNFPFKPIRRWQFSHNSADCGFTLQANPQMAIHSSSSTAATGCSLVILQIADTAPVRQCNAASCVYLHVSKWYNAHNFDHCLFAFWQFLLYVCYT